MTEQPTLIVDQVKRETARLEGERLALGRLADDGCERCAGGGIVGYNRMVKISIPCPCTKLTPAVWLKVWTRACREAERKQQPQIVGPNGASIQSQPETPEIT